MKFDFESLSTEPLFYMLMHSGAFVCVLGFIFFIVGLLFGYATWGRFKRQTRRLQGETSALKDEIASLKRKVGDHSILSGPAIPMATETIYMPKKEGTPPAEAAPAVTVETIITQDIRLPAAAPAPKAELKPETAAPPAADPAPQAAPLPVPPPAVPATASVEPSSAELPPPPSPHASPLAAIISAPHAREKPETGADAPAEGLVTADILPPLTELLLPALPELEFQPQLELKLESSRDSELNPKLGFIYKTRPEKTDDLTVIEGISPVLAQRLHDIGVYTYEQIAAWDDDHVKEFSSRLAFKDRIRRERWVEQARDIAIKKTAV